MAKRAGLSEVEWMITAREAERALGRMILAAREAGDLADQGGDRAKSDVSTLLDLGISRDLAADAVALARVPDEAWPESSVAVGNCSTEPRQPFPRTGELDG
jgi:hypothetical protein